ncbi:hypothetical protein [Candidatus Binatus sp.]
MGNITPGRQSWQGPPGRGCGCSSAGADSTDAVALHYNLPEIVGN